MSHYPLDELIARWTQEKVTETQVIGQLLQLLRVHDARLRALARAARAPAAPATPPPPPERKLPT